MCGTRSQEWSRFVDFCTDYPDRVRAGDVPQGIDPRTAIEDLVRSGKVNRTEPAEDPVGHHWWRVRVFSDEASVDLSADGMGPPPSWVPAEKIRSGRANRIGERVLYVAEELGTALQEGRAELGKTVGAAQFRAKRDLQILDLTAIVGKYESPWTFFFGDLAQELGVRVEEGPDPPPYLACQYAVAVIREAEWNDVHGRVHHIDGICYQSAQWSNDRKRNLVVFDPCLMEMVSGTAKQASDGEIGRALRGEEPPQEIERIDL